jgi:acyl-CoA thioesterase
MESGNEALEYAKEIVAKDPWSTYLGIELQEVRPQYARVSMPVRPEYCNAVERAHGAAVYSAADQAFAVACNSDGYKAVALTVTVHYLAGAPAGSTIIAEAQPKSILRKISLWNIEVKTEDGTLIATAEGTAYHR